MYFTDYFNGLKINSIETTIIDLINDIDSLSNIVSKIRDTIKDTNDWDMRPGYQKLGSNLHYGSGSSDPNSSTYNPVSAKAYLNTPSGGSHDF